MFKKLLKAGLAISLGSTLLAGCGVTPGGTSLMASNGSIQMASKSVIDSFGHGLGWISKGTTPIVDDLPAGHIPSLGFQLQDLQPAASTKSVDLRPYCSPIYDQGYFGSCTSFAMVKGLKEFMELKDIRAKGGDPAKDFVPLSPAFLWFNERAYTGNQTQDTGSDMFLGMNMLTSYGAPPEASYPYPTTTQQRDPWFLKYFLPATPSDQVYAQASDMKGGSIQQITKLSQVKASLNAGYPVVFGFLVFDSIRKVGADGMLPLPNLQTDQCLGGHATMAVGYDDARQVLTLRNSWGPNWGDHGYFYMPYKYFDMDLGLVADGWTMRE